MSQSFTVGNKEIPVEQFRNDWALALMSQGVIVRLYISRWRAKAALTPEILGLRFSGADGVEFSDKYLNLGTQKLLPPSVLSQFVATERHARDLLEYYSFDTVWGKFVPFTAFDEWEKKNRQIHDDFLNHALLLGNQYKDIVASVKEDYKKMAKDVWLRLYPEDKGGPTESFIENFADKVIAKIPSQEDIVASFKYSSTYFIIPMPSFIADDLAKADHIKRQSEMEQFTSDLEKQTKKHIAEEYAKSKKELIDGFLESTVVSMRKYVSELCDAVLISLGKVQKRNQTMNSAHINKLKDMIKKVRILNFYEDKEIAVLVKDLESELDKIKGEVNPETIVDKLKEIVEVSKKEYVPHFNPAISVLEV